MSSLQVSSDSDLSIEQSRPQLKETVEVLEASNGSIYLIPATGEHDFEFVNVSDIEKQLLQALNGTQPALDIATSLCQQFGTVTEDEILASIASLAEAGLVTDARANTQTLTVQQQLKYSRQLAYFTDMLPYAADNHVPQEHLTAGTVVILGLGGVGSWVAQSLAAIGVGHLILVDGDTVELSNLNRQILYTEADLGDPKATVARERLRAINEQIKITKIAQFLGSPQDMNRVVEKADLVIEAADTPVHDLSRWVDVACRARGIPHITMSQIPPLVRIGPMFVPHKTGCLACYEKPDRDNFPFFDELVDQRRRNAPTAAATAAGCALIGGMVSSDVMHYLTGLATPATLGAAYTIDMQTLTITKETVQRDSSCPDCSED